jgi:hypothetical protein
MTKDPQHELGEQEDHGDVSDHYFGRGIKPELVDAQQDQLAIEEAMLNSRAVTRYEWREPKQPHFIRRVFAAAWAGAKAGMKAGWRGKSPFLAGYHAGVKAQPFHRPTNDQLLSAAIAVLILGTAICFAILLAAGGK